MTFGWLELLISWRSGSSAKEPGQAGSVGQGQLCKVQQGQKLSPTLRSQQPSTTGWRQSGWEVA